MAYIGPGAGFAFLGSFLVLLVALAMVFAAVVSWPFRVLLTLAFARRRRPRGATARRVIVLGLDGLDPRRCERLMDAGRLPHFARLRETGAFARLATTCPPLSPVAWSSFATGVNPGKHNIFDFLNRDLRTLLPELSSSRLETTARGRASFRLLRRSKPFWNLLGEHGVFSTILRVPITFPPEPFRGLCLAGMCAPDLRGTQGSFTCFTDAPSAGAATGGCVLPLTFRDRRAEARLPGPPDPAHPHRNLEIPLRLRLAPGDHGVILRVSGQTLRLQPGVYSDWTRLVFRAGPWRRISGLCRFLVASLRPFRLYLTPLQIDPERPALPIAYPPSYAIYLAKLLGPFATLGLAEDTWARNEGVIDDATFLDQVYAIHAERERMFFAALDRTRRGACVCVFDASDRIQHMFLRTGAGEDAESERTIEEMYLRMDALVGRTLERTRTGDFLFVISDHGFTHFRRGVNLNAWLREQGYLQPLPGHEQDAYLQAVDWSHTRAYTFGLSGIYLNRKGREARGIVDAAEAAALKEELAERLRALRDPDHPDAPPAVRAVYDSAAVYTGPYRDNGPDLVVGFADGYRASWDAAIGRTDGAVFTDNPKAWTGDHCVDQALVPGVFLCNRALAGELAPRLMDMAPTILALLGVKPPPHMDGRPLALQPPPP